MVLKGCEDYQWMCDDGTCINLFYYCDGTYEQGHNVWWAADCPDGSDEILERCCADNI